VLEQPPPLSAVVAVGVCVLVRAGAVASCLRWRAARAPRWTRPRPGSRAGSKAAALRRGRRRGPRGRKAQGRPAAKR